MKKISLILASLAMIFAISCKNNSKKADADKLKEDVQDAMTIEDEAQTQVTLSKITDFPAYDDVTFDLKEPSTTSFKPGEITFDFEVKNMEIGAQTEGQEDLGLANVDGGQHIHFIIDNQPYMAMYEKNFTHELEEGVHTMVAFPARSYHMAVKNDNAIVATKFTVGNPADDQFSEVDFDQPTLIYSRPKGDYTGAGETQKVLLDFYLLNADLSANGNKVKATINGEEFILDDWAPYAIEGLPLGENTVRLELIDKDGNAIDGPFNDTERTFTLK